MKHRKMVFFLLGLTLVFILAIGQWSLAEAAQKNHSVTKSLEYQKPVDVSLGRGGVYFSSSSYTGSVVLTRIKAEPHKKLTFTRRWSDIHLFDTKGKLQEHFVAVSPPGEYIVAQAEYTQYKCDGSETNKYDL